MQNLKNPERDGEGQMIKKGHVTRMIICEETLAFSVFLTFKYIAVFDN